MDQLPVSANQSQTPPPLPSTSATGPGMPQPSKHAWYRSAWFHTVLFIILPYVQVPLMWILKAFTLRTRIIVTLLGVLFVIGIIIGASQDAQLSNTTTEPTATAASPNDSSEVEEIGGKVMSVTDDGVLVDKRRLTVGFDVPPYPIFIKGRFPNTVDGDQVTVNAVREGTYRYQTALGNVATVPRYRAIQ